MIYHYPGNLPISSESGSTLRPRSMLNAFIEIGFDVQLIHGTIQDRERKIEKLRQQICVGEKFLFAYSESSWLPTLIADGNKLPNWNCIDFRFFRYCKIQGISCGMFYRDIYWKFGRLSAEMGLNCIKSHYVKSLYLLDLMIYNQYLKILFLPSKKMKEQNPEIKIRSEALPPGLNMKNLMHTLKHEDESQLRILYVGGLSNLSVIDNLIGTVKKFDFLHLTICTNRSHWAREKVRYSKFLCDRINVVHLSGDELIPLYQNADLGALFYKPNVYKSFTASTKLFQYMENDLPILATKSTFDGDFVESNEIGWSLPYEIEQLSFTLFAIWKNRKFLELKKRNLQSIKKNHTWAQRAKKAAELLTEKRYT